MKKRKRSAMRLMVGFERNWRCWKIKNEEQNAGGRYVEILYGFYIGEGEDTVETVIRNFLNFILKKEIIDLNFFFVIVIDFYFHT